MEKEKLCEHLIVWLSSYPDAADIKSVEDLADGVVIAKILNAVSPDFFEDVWLSRIKQDGNMNWRLKVSNLKKILKAMVEFHTEKLELDLSDFRLPVLQEIAENNSEHEMGRFLQLVLSCVVNGDNKDEHIQRIMSMEQNLQQIIMLAIQEVMVMNRDTNDGTNELEMKHRGSSVRKTLEEYNQVLIAREEMNQRCHELDMQVSGLLEEKNTLQQENERLLKKIEEMSNNTPVNDSVDAAAAARQRQLQEQIEILKDEVYHLEVMKEEARTRLEAVETQRFEDRSRVEQLTRAADEAQSLKDELDEMRARAEKVNKMEATMEAWKKKIDESGDLRRQLKLSEEKNAEYLQRTLELEEEIRRTASFKNQMDIYKKEMSELGVKCSRETQRADKAEFEVKRQTDRVEGLVQDKERLIREREKLRERTEELEALNSRPGDNGEGGTHEDLDHEVDLSLPPEVRQRLTRLEHENRLLRARIDSDQSAGMTALQNLLDDSKGRARELDEQNRTAHQRILELSAELEDARTTAQMQEAEAASLAPRTTSSPASTDARCRAAETRAAELQRQLSRREEDMRAMEERYKRYLEKAKLVIRSLDAKHSSLGESTSEVMSLQHQLDEKTRILEQMQRQQEKSRAARDDEEKLIIAAWYNLGLRLNTQAPEERLSGARNTGQSFLARQRAAHGGGASVLTPGGSGAAQ